MHAAALLAASLTFAQTSPRTLGTPLPIAPLAPLGGLGVPLDPAPPAPTAWPEADRLFRDDPRWLGGDAAYSVDLGGGRTLWLFGDSFVDPSGGGDRSRSALVRNSVGLQSGVDPASASMEFHWGSRGGRPSASFEAPDGEWLWPGHGLRLGSRLILFFMRVRTKGEGVFGFEAFGWTSRVIENPDSPPREWVAREASSGEGCLAGAGGVWKEEGFLYAMSPATDGSGMRLARWRVEQAEAGALSRPQWWTGAGWGEDGPAAALFRPAPTEASVLRDERGLTLVQTAEGGAIAIRRASRPEGPWSEPETMFTPPEASRPDTFAYAGKAHAQLGRVATYATNAWEPERLLEDRELYFPRFVRLPPLGGD